ncbi:AAEL002635-PA [Aedes aegypti]|uniref:AAEL002635-PA n=1 Tax=Aedes aegypti TaxID=7159 RepID=Q17HL2_AEDAE|nr:AAEL002635-PA [Aedes aegypti]
MHGKHNDDSEENSTIRYRKTQDTPITGKQIKETGKLVQEEGKQWQWNKERNNQKKSDDKKAVEKNMDERGNETRKITREKHKPINKDRAITKDFITDNRKEEILDLEEKRRRQRSKEREDRLEQLATQIKTNEERSMLINGSQRQGWEENDSQERLDREKQAKTDKNTRGRIQMDLGDKKENPRISTKQRNDRKRAKNERESRSRRKRRNKKGTSNRKRRIKSNGSKSNRRNK